MAHYSDWAGPHRASSRKSDKYMPWDAFPYASSRKPAARPEPRWSTGVAAFDKAVRSAIRGKRNDSEIACLRGALRKAVIELADSCRASVGARGREIAITRFREELRGYAIVGERIDGGVSWQRRLPRPGVWVEGGIYPP